MVYNLDKIDSREFIPGFHGKMIHGDKTTMAYWDIEQGASVQQHSHHHEQVVNVLEGRFEMDVNGTIHQLEAGDVLLIPSHVSHGGTARTRCRILDVFTPVREEYR